MADANPLIALGTKPVEIPAMANPLSTLGTVLDLQKAQMGNRSMEMTFRANQAMGEIFATSATPEEAIERITKSQWAPFAGAAIGAYRQAAKTKVDMEATQLGMRKTEMEMGKIPLEMQKLAAETGKIGLDTAHTAQTMSGEGFTGFIKGMPAGINDPAALANWQKSYLATLPEGLRKQLAPVVNDYVKAMTAGLPEDPALRQSVFNQRIVGAATANGSLDQKGVETILGGQELTDVGGSLQPVRRLPMQLGGGFIPNGPAFGKTLEPQISQGVGPDGQPMAVGGAYGVPGTTPSNALGVPPIPPQGAPLGQGLVEKNYSEGRGKSLATAQENLDSTVTNGAVVMKTVAEMRNALKSIDTGGGAEFRTKFAGFADALGASREMVDKIANGDRGASQELQKLMVNTVMAQIKQQLPAGSRMAQQEFQVFQDKNPNLETDPRAIQKIFNFWTKNYTQALAEQDWLSEHLEKGGKITDWPRLWPKEAAKRGFVVPKLEEDEGQKTDRSKEKKPAERPSLDSLIK